MSQHMPPTFGFCFERGLPSLPTSIHFRVTTYILIMQFLYIRLNLPVSRRFSFLIRRRVGSRIT